MDIEEDVVGFVDGLDDGGAEGDVVHEMAVHDIEVEPIGTGEDGARDFLADF